MIYSKLNPYAMQRHAGRGPSGGGSSGSGAGTGSGGGGAGAPAGAFLLDTCSSAALEDLTDHVGEIGAEWTPNEVTAGYIVEDGLWAVGGDVPGVYAFAEEFDTIPNSRPPSGGPADFTSETGDCTIVDSVIYTTAPGYNGWATFMGSETAVTSPTRVYRIGLVFDGANLPAVGSYVALSFGESLPGDYEPEIKVNTTFDGTFNVDGTTSLEMETNNYEGGVLLTDAFADATPVMDVWTVGTGVPHELRLELSIPDGIKGYFDDVELFSAPWTDVDLSHVPTLRYVSFDIDGKGIGIAYIRCDEDV